MCTVVAKCVSQVVLLYFQQLILKRFKTLSVYNPFQEHDAQLSFFLAEDTSCCLRQAVIIQRLNNLLGIIKYYSYQIYKTVSGY